MLTFREHFPDYRRDLLFSDQAGLRFKTVREQPEIVRTEVVPVLRKEFDAMCPDQVPYGPTHASRKQEAIYRSEESAAESVAVAGETR